MVGLVPTILLFLQRLRTENRLLKQRIDTLEKVSHSCMLNEKGRTNLCPSNHFYICQLQYIVMITIIIDP